MWGYVDLLFSFYIISRDFISNRLQHAQESGYDEVDAVTFLLK